MFKEARLRTLAFICRSDCDSFSYCRSQGWTFSLRVNDSVRGLDDFLFSRPVTAHQRIKNRIQAQTIARIRPKLELRPVSCAHGAFALAAQIRFAPGVDIRFLFTRDSADDGFLGCCFYDSIGW